MLRIHLPVLIAATLMSAPAFAQAEDHAPVNLRSADELRHDKKESWTYIKPGINISNITSVQIMPTTVYRGPDSQFENVDAADRQKFAQILTDALRTEMADAFQVTSKPNANTLRIQMTLIGAEKTTEGVSTATSVMPMGLATSAVKSLMGKKGTFTGSVLVAVEIYRASNNELLAAAVRRESPDALDIPATISTSETVKAAARNLARRLRDRLVAVKSGNR